jgi:hypothetical protein
MFRKPSHRVPAPKVPAHRHRELARSNAVAEARRLHPHLFHQPHQ